MALYSLYDVFHVTAYKGQAIYKTKDTGSQVWVRIDNGGSRNLPVIGKDMILVTPSNGGECKNLPQEALWFYKE